MTEVADSMMDRISGIRCALSTHRAFLAVVLIGIIVRIVIAPIINQNNDVIYWVRIANMADSGLGMYDIEGYHYMPSWGYFVSFISFVCLMFGITTFAVPHNELTAVFQYGLPSEVLVPTAGFAVVLKIFLILVDLAVAVLLYRVLSDFTKDRRIAATASAIWFLAPVLVLETAGHAMFDNISALFVLISMVLVYKGRYFLSGASMFLAVMTKFMPLFLIPVMLAWILRRERISMTGLRSTAKFVIGCISVFVLLELPEIVAGNFWASMYFITMRAGDTVGMLTGVLSPAVLAAIAMLAVIIAALVIRWMERNRGRLMGFAAKMSEPASARKVAEVLLALWGIASLAIIAISSAGGSVSLSTFMIVVFLLSAVVELYLAYHVLFRMEDDSERLMSILMLASLAMFIWSPAPQYILVAIPIFAAYAAVYRPGLIRPLVFFTVAYVLLTFGYGNLIYVYTLAADLGWISLDSLYSAAEFLATPVFGTYLDDLLCTITDVTAEISLIYLAYRWYTESKSPLQGDLHGVPVFV